MERVFIVGCPRSGTTLLQRMLASHSRAHTFPETHFFSKLAEKPGGSKVFGWYVGPARHALLELLVKIKRRDLTGTVPRVPLGKERFARSFVRICDRLAADAGKDVWVEKTPRHLHHADEIAGYVAGAKFIHVVRSGKGTVASLYRVAAAYPAQWHGRRSLDECIERWKEDVRVTLGYLGLPNHAVVGYEALVADPARELAGLCDRLGISFEQEMISRPPSSWTAVADEPWKSNAVQPPRHDRAARKRKTLGPGLGEYIADRTRVEQQQLDNALNGTAHAGGRMTGTRVVMVPVAENPYQFLLGRGLEKLGVPVMHRRVLPGFGSLWRNRRAPLIYHMHWLPVLYRGRLPVSMAGSAALLVRLLFTRMCGYRIVWTVCVISPAPTPQNRLVRHPIIAAFDTPESPDPPLFG